MVDVEEYPDLLGSKENACTALFGVATRDFQDPRYYLYTMKDDNSERTNNSLENETKYRVILA